VGSTTLCASDNLNTNKLTPLVNLNINSQTFESLLDTGASHSFISKSIVDTLNMKTSKSSLSHVTIGNSSKTLVEGTYRINIKLDDKPYAWKFLVLSTLPVDIILGADFINNARIVIDIHSNSYFYSPNPKQIFPFINTAFLCLLEALKEDKKVDLNNLLHEFKDTMSSDIGHTDLLKCKLDVVGQPVALKPYPVSPGKRKLIKNM